MMPTTAIGSSRYVYHRAPTDSGCFGGMLGSGGPVVTSSGVLQYTTTGLNLREGPSGPRCEQRAAHARLAPDGVVNLSPNAMSRPHKATGLQKSPVRSPPSSAARGPDGAEKVELF